MTLVFIVIIPVQKLLFSFRLGYQILDLSFLVLAIQAKKRRGKGTKSKQLKRGAGKTEKKSRYGFDILSEICRGLGVRLKRCFKLFHSQIQSPPPKYDSDNDDDDNSDSEEQEDVSDYKKGMGISVLKLCRFSQRDP